MLYKNKYVLAGISTAVAILSIGGYFLHKKVLKHRLREERQQAMNLALFDLDADENGDDDYYDEMFQDLDDE